MKRTIKMFAVFSVLSLAVTGAKAQDFGLQAGYVSSTQNNDDPVSGFQVGPVAEYPLAGPVTLQYGVLYSYQSRSYDAVIGTNTYTGQFIDFPVKLKLNFPVDENLKIFALAGPDLNFGLSQQLKNVTNAFGQTVVTTVDYYNIDDNNDDKKDISRFDVQLGIGGGIQYNNLQLKAVYDWGILDTNNTDNTELKRNVLTVSAVFMF